MPQTEEEHLYGLDDENESIEDHSHDAQHRNTEADIEVIHHGKYSRNFTFVDTCRICL